MRIVSLTLLFVICLITTSWAKSDERKWCGTTRPVGDTYYTIKKHLKHMKDLRALSASLPRTKSADVGEIAVMEGNSNTIIDPNRFDLDGKKITFSRTPGGTYKVKVTNGGISGTDGEEITLGDDDSTEIDFTSGFSFRFFNEVFQGVFINSDGNLTFKRKDSESTPRDTGRFLAGPPRLALLFTDLDPTVAGEIRVLQTSTKFRVTWRNVPEFGTRNNNTIQMTMHKSGKIEFVFGQVQTELAVVGISPGSTGDVEVVDYTKLGGLPPQDGAVVERFAPTLDVDYAALIQEFHRTHPKVFDFVAIFTDFPYQHPGFAFFSPAQNKVKGLGLPRFDASELFGSNRLQGFLLMGYIGKYPDDPDRTFLGTNSTLDILGQENGHRWLAFPRVVINGQATNDLLGRDDSHWSFNFDSDASDMEGNDIRDNGNGTFTTVDATSQYSQLDRYFMGLIPASKVPPSFFVDPGIFKAAAPEIGVILNGTRVNVTIQQIIQAEGPRIPSSARSQKRFREAFIFLTKQGQTASQKDIDKLDRIRKAWSSYFRNKTGRRGRLNTTLP